MTHSVISNRTTPLASAHARCYVAANNITHSGMTIQLMTLQGCWIGKAKAPCQELDVLQNDEADEQHNREWSRNEPIRTNNA